MPSIATKTSELLRLAGSGPLLTRDVDAAGIPRVYLRRLCERGLLERVDRGLYRLPEAPVTELHSLVEVARRVPHATIALLSALQVHGLTTEAPHAVWMLIDRHARTPKVTYPKLEVVYASGPALVHGVETRTIEGVPVRLTTPAKTVADCFQVPAARRPGGRARGAAGLPRAPSRKRYKAHRLAHRCAGRRRPRRPDLRVHPALPGGPRVKGKPNVGARRVSACSAWPRSAATTSNSSSCAT